MASKQKPDITICLQCGLWVYELYMGRFERIISIAVSDSKGHLQWQISIYSLRINLLPSSLYAFYLMLAAYMYVNSDFCTSIFSHESEEFFIFF